MDEYRKRPRERADSGQRWRDAYSYAVTNGYPNPRDYADTYCDAFGDSEPYAFADALFNAYPYPDAQSDADRNAISDPYPNRGRDTDARGVLDVHPHIGTVEALHIERGAQWLEDFGVDRVRCDVTDVEKGREVGLR